MPKFLHSAADKDVLQNFQYCQKGPDILVAFSMLPALDTNLWSKPYLHFQFHTERYANFSLIKY